MCWKSVKNVEPKKAEKDIHVYKICLAFAERAFPYYMPGMVSYKIGGTYASDFFDEPIIKNGTYTINHAIHSFSCKCELFSTTYLLGVLDTNGITIGYYDQNKGICIALCTIPKGTTYYLNETGEYVSEFIKMNEFVNITKDIHKNELELAFLNNKLKKWNNQ